MDTPRPTPERPELLAPAGSLEAFFAAMDSGADAAYVGLKEFSARAKAKNFSLAELERMLAYAHHHQKRLFVTLNTLVKQHELPLLCETLAALEALRADAVIVQDLAVWNLARTHFPNLELHASTQMTIHNAAGVKQLEAMGFKRAVLARELTLEEITAIRAQTRLELEHFIHGALCFSFSGQCTFSSWLGGKSGNRGRCAQPCRRRYSFRGKDGYYFSPNDLSAIDLLPQLAAAGVCSFKIEGRMKSAEYVASVVSAYRSVLDAPAKHRRETIQAAKELLKESFGRLPTRGFLSGPDPTDIAVPSIKGSTGKLLGELNQVRGTRLGFQTRDRLHVGDRLRIQPRSDKAGTAFTVKTLYVGGKPCKRAAAGAFVSVTTPFRDQFRKGDSVFKVSSEKAYTLSDQAARKRLARFTTSETLFDLDVELENNTLSLHARTDDFSHSWKFDVTTFPAEKNPLGTETLRPLFEQRGDKPLALRELSCRLLPEVVIPPSELKQIRRDLYNELEKLVRRHREAQRLSHQKNALASLPSDRAAAPTPSPAHRILLRDGRDLHILAEGSFDDAILPLTPSVVEQLFTRSQRARRYLQRIIWDIPMILTGERWGETRKLVNAVYHQGMKRFRLNNLGHFPLVSDLPGVEIETSWRLFTLNSEAARGWQQLGAARCETYLEDDHENLMALLQHGSETPLGSLAYSPTPLLTSRINIRSLPKRATLQSDRGDTYRVERKQNLTELYAETDVSLIGHLHELAQLGIAFFTVDVSHLGAFSPTGKRILDALRHNREIPGTSTFNYLHHLE